MTLNDSDRETQAKLKIALQDESKATKLESLAAALLGRLLGVTVTVAKSGFQHGGDAGPAGRQGRRFRVECKKYGVNTALRERDLLGEIDQSLARDPALEAWVLVATREVNEQLQQSLNQKGESVGVPVIILDWQSNDLASLAALCAFGPDLVESILSFEASVLAQALQPVSLEAIERLRLDLQAWNLGFEALRTRFSADLETMWRSPRESNAALGQNAAGGAEQHRVRRQGVHTALDAWWSGAAKNDAPAVVVGWDGIGKTWATLDWLVDRRESLPITLVVPSSSAAELTGASTTAVKRFLADRLYEHSGVRDRDHWLRRIDRLLKRPADEGPALVVFFDGLNQEPSLAWLLLLKALQSEAFAGRLCVIVSTRTFYYENKLGSLRGLVVPPVVVKVDGYDTKPGGEIDQMLAFEHLTKNDLHPDLLELARTPRLFRLVVKSLEHLVDAGQVTIHRLLWEYGRDTFGQRAGRSFSEDDWRAWLQEIAGRHRDGVREFSLKTLGETASRPDLSAREVYARLSDVVDGQFTDLGPSGNLQLKPTVVAHALGAALLSFMDSIAAATFDAADTELANWLDPIAGLDQRAEIMRAAVSILVERGGTAGTPLAGVLVTSWLQTQNVTDTHRRDLVALAGSLPNALLDAVEHSVARTHSSARLWAVTALRAIKRSDVHAQAAIMNRSQRWLSSVSRDARTAPGISDDAESNRSKHLVSLIGRDASGPLKLLGAEVELVDSDDGVLAATVPCILEGFPLAAAAQVFEVAAIALAVRGRSESWDGLKWLCLLNQVDPEETMLALRALSNEIAKRTPEAEVDRALPVRVASLLLRLTGEEEDETTAVAIDPGVEHGLTYANDYLGQPSRSRFALERRHAADTLNDTSLRLHFRIQRTRELWLDPTFSPPERFVQEVRAAAALVDINKLNRQGSSTSEDYEFEELEPVLAHCASDLLANLIRRKVQAYRNCPPDSRFWSANAATDHLILASAPESEAARVLRLSAREEKVSHELYAASKLLIVELHRESSSVQAHEIISASLEDILLDMGEILGPLAPAEADSLIGRFDSIPVTQRRVLLLLLCRDGVAFSDTAWVWLSKAAFGIDSNLHGPAFRALATCNGTRFGRELWVRQWAWSAVADHWVNQYGSGALIEGTAGVPFDQVAPRLAPWRLLEAARRRGADPSDVLLAASMFGAVLAADEVEAPDPGSTLSVDRRKTESGLFRFSVAPHQSDGAAEEPFAVLRAAMDTEAQVKALNRAVHIAVGRIREARASGASLYLADVASRDIEPVLRHAPHLIEQWLEGSKQPTADFDRRVELAEAAYLAICEVLLEHEPSRGVALWQTLRQVMSTQIVSAADVEELVHMAFRAPDTPIVNLLRAQILGLDFCRSDQDLLNVAIAAAFNGKTRWLSGVIEEDRLSKLAWRRKRGIVLQGFTCGNSLPVTEAWSDDEIRTNHEALQRWSARFRYREACAHHWWRVYLAAENCVDAYAAWVLFVHSADGRVWVWMDNDARALNLADALSRLKISHARLNRSNLRRAVEKREDKLDEHFLHRKIVTGVGPWFNEPG